MEFKLKITAAAATATPTAPCANALQFLTALLVPKGHGLKPSSESFLCDAA